MDKNHFEILPTEMIIEIISYLNLFDIKSLRLTCTTFEQLSEDALLTKAVVKCIRLQQDLNWLMTINKKIKTIHFFHRFDEHEVEKIISHFKDSITELHLANCHFNEERLIKSFNQLPHLKTVRIDTLHTLRGLNLANVIMPLYQRVETIHINGSTYYIDNSITEENNYGVMESTLRDLSVQLWSPKLFEVIRSSLRTLDLSRVFNKDLLKSLADLNLNLNQLKIRVHKETSDQDFMSFVMSMKNLKKISFSGPGSGITNQRVKLICENIPGLKHLEFMKFAMITDEGIKYASALSKLECLILTSSLNAEVTSVGLIEGFGRRQNNQLALLKLTGNLNDDTIILSTTNLNNLTKLSLETQLRFSPDLIPLIYENLPLLETLTLRSYGVDLKSQQSRLTRPQFKSSDPRIYQLKRLRRIFFAGFAQVPGASFDDMANLRFLKKIHATTEENLELETFKKMVNNNPELKSLTIKRSSVRGVQHLDGVTDAIPNRLFRFNYGRPSGRADGIKICIKRTL